MTHYDQFVEQWKNVQNTEKYADVIMAL